MTDGGRRLRVLLFLDVDGTLLPFGAAGPYPLYERPFRRPGPSPAIRC